MLSINKFRDSKKSWNIFELENRTAYAFTVLKKKIIRGMVCS